MIGVVQNTEVYIPISQPITQQILPWINPWYEGNAISSQIQAWSVVGGKWLDLADPSALRVALPLTEIPVLRLRSMRECRPHPDDIARGRAVLPPMCSMKAQMYDLPYIWPQGLRIPRSKHDGVWRVSHNQSTPGVVIKPWGPHWPGVGAAVYPDNSANNGVLGNPATDNVPA